jgi:hypothetical protein
MDKNRSHKVTRGGTTYMMKSPAAGTHRPPTNPGQSAELSSLSWSCATPEERKKFVRDVGNDLLTTFTSVYPEATLEQAWEKVTARARESFVKTHLDEIIALVEPEQLTVRQPKIVEAQNELH